MIRRSGSRGTPSARTIRPAALRPGARPGGGVRRTRPIRRASAGLTPVRAGALLAALAGVAALYGLGSSGAFEVQRTTVTGTTWTDEQQVLEALAIPEGTNLFTIRTGDLEAAVAAIPAIADVTVSIALPDEIRVFVTEREALVTWKVGDRRFLVDADGMLFAGLPEDPPDAAAALPVIDDARLASVSLEIGSVLDAVTLDAALRLGSLEPADVGSRARALVLRIDDASGFTMRTRPASWAAVFGFYTPTLRTTGMIPGQVRLLRSLLAGREDTVARIVLADERSGTFVPRETPAPTTTPKPAKTPKPARTPRPSASPEPVASAVP